MRRQHLALFAKVRRQEIDDRNQRLLGHQPMIHTMPNSSGFGRCQAFVPARLHEISEVSPCFTVEASAVPYGLVRSGDRLPVRRARFRLLESRGLGGKAEFVPRDSNCPPYSRLVVLQLNLIRPPATHFRRHRTLPAPENGQKSPALIMGHCPDVDGVYYLSHKLRISSEIIFRSKSHDGFRNRLIGKEMHRVHCCVRALDCSISIGLLSALGPSE